MNWKRCTRQSHTLGSDKHLQLQLAYANYGLAGTCIGSGNEDRGEQACKDGIAYASKLLKDENYASEAYALLSGLFGMQIAFNPMKGMYLGPKSDKYVAKAIALNDKNAFAYLQKGSSLFNTPAMFGGSVKKSVEQFEKAISIYQESAIPMNLWELEAKVWLGQAYASIGELDKAKSIYLAILKETPEFAWVKSYLLPNVESQL